MVKKWIWAVRTSVGEVMSLWAALTANLLSDDLSGKGVGFCSPALGSESHARCGRLDEVLLPDLMV
jgi:hypothetical protein